MVSSGWAVCTRMRLQSSLGPCDLNCPDGFVGLWSRAILAAMPLPRRRHEDFEASRMYEYPQHLREAIEDVPTGAGVYTFHGQAGDLPLYIGCLLYTSPSPRDRTRSRMPSSA